MKSRRKKQSQETVKSRSRLWPFLAVGLILFFIWHAWHNSVLVHTSDRVTVAVYGETTTVYSFGIEDGITYAFVFPPDLRLTIPGGYGEYRTGAVGKLTALENNPDIIRRTFALATASFVDLYYYPASETIYYGEEAQRSSAFRHNFWSLSSLKTNGSIIDTLYLSYIIGKKGDSFAVISPSSVEDFRKSYMGYLYRDPFRQENKTVQIRYANRYAVATAVSDILEGTGINVSDLSVDDGVVEQCTIIENTAEPSQTAAAISAFFGCRIGQGETDIYDILVTLGPIESSWEI